MLLESKFRATAAFGPELRSAGTVEQSYAEVLWAFTHPLGTERLRYGTITRDGIMLTIPRVSAYFDDGLVEEENILLCDSEAEAERFESDLYLYLVLELKRTGGDTKTLSLRNS